MTTTKKTRPVFLAMLVLLLAAAMAAATLAAPGSAQAAPGKANPAKTCSSTGDTIFSSPSNHGGCTSFAASGKLTGAGYSAQCKILADEFGGYPFVFQEPFGDFPVKNHGECVNTLRYLHTTYGG